ncbi:Metal-dependent hydrolase, endonuclease/exonuclease/phosphatase family [Actinokineospora iranica]|uniref:Metal-dependent hydrolase, endonuclease/exonuclease/phosphatase family n=1 Tax=Actinokineospora iranica TaxID=1271860 RepID=A0A1G6Y1X5_9PSEU|nr:Metal-dependent hydrolase, endonuclease/exonuclease/phosphatase family [Actinokineospora iranica]
MRRQPTAIEDLDPEPPRRRRRRGVTAFLVLLVLPLLAICVLRLGRIDGNRFTVAALALTPYFAGYGLLVTLLALALRRALITLVALVLTASLAILVIPRLLSDGDLIPEGQHVRVFSANLLLGRADPATVVRLIRDTQADIVTLQELTPQAMAALDKAGLADLLPYRVLRTRTGGEGSGILARVPLRQIVLVQNRMSFEQPAAVVDLSGPVDIEILSVHTIPPVPNATVRHRWNQELAAMPPPDARARPRILSGDFNATLDHRALNDLLDRGYHDAAELAGEGLRPTWSQPPFGPPVTIDHILVDRRVGVTKVAVYDLPGSDHNAVFAELALPPGPRN